ncbi:MAG: phospho-N-acetylmuramoyl-pentapeptide-transferase [Aeromicrobium sp.]|uniref:phospho-N-acetylmuramoyl-pentapeptide- transferase n=1 Tax=Aeromicrobium sp. TaxID=1871063 RepID=UPI0039E587AB
MLAILIAGAVSLLGTLLGTRLAITILVAKGYGQEIRDDGPTSHHTKRGTPTMGGLVIIFAVVLGYAAAHLSGQSPPTASGLLLLFLFVGLGVIGFLDDWIKIVRQRSLGLRSKAKMIGQIAVGLAFALLAIGYEDDAGNTVITHAISLTRDFSWELPTVLLVVWVLLLVAGTSNGVNLTDGLDGLATGASAMVFGAFVLINLWQSNQNCEVVPEVAKCYEVRDPLDLAVVASALAGACVGFLWWNTSPAKIFMGDTGSLSLGGAMAGFAMTTRTELLLVILGGLFVVITASVILQVGYFKATGGKRIFRMAPLQHHFELLGWAEVTIVVRFWLISVLCVAVGLGVFYWEWVTGL